MTWARLTQQLRSTARELSTTQPAASTKLRGALNGMDENDLGTRMQRSSDWLRSGNFSDPAETALTNDLQKLGQQVSEAARALGNGQPTSKDASLNRAMDDLSRLRDQLAGLGKLTRQAGPTRRPTISNRLPVAQRATRPRRTTTESVGARRSSQGGQPRWQAKPVK